MISDKFNSVIEELVKTHGVKDIRPSKQLVEVYKAYETLDKDYKERLSQVVEEFKDMATGKKKVEGEYQTVSDGSLTLIRRPANGKEKQLVPEVEFVGVLVSQSQASNQTGTFGYFSKPNPKDNKPKMLGAIATSALINNQVDSAQTIVSSTPLLLSSPADRSTMITVQVHDKIIYYRVNVLPFHPQCRVLFKNEGDSQSFLFAQPHQPNGSLELITVTKRPTLNIDTVEQKYFNQATGQEVTPQTRTIIMSDGSFVTTVNGLSKTKQPLGIYEGYTDNNGNRHGLGIFVANVIGDDSLRFEGEFENEKARRGKLIRPNYYYEGALDDNGVYSGKGMLKKQTGGTLVGEFSKGSVKNAYLTTTIEEAKESLRLNNIAISDQSMKSMVDEAKHLEFPQNVWSQYWGECKDSGVKHGKGEYRDISGMYLRGRFENDLMVGQGTMKNLKTGVVYVGYLANGVPGGKGRLTQANGDFQEGEWDSTTGQCTGKGRVRMGNKVFKGTWNNGVLENPEEDDDHDDDDNDHGNGSTGKKPGSSTANPSPPLSKFAGPPLFWGGLARKPPVVFYPRVYRASGLYGACARVLKKILK